MPLSKTRCLAVVVRVLFRLFAFSFRCCVLVHVYSRYRARAQSLCLSQDREEMREMLAAAVQFLQALVAHKLGSDHVHLWNVVGRIDPNMRKVAPYAISAQIHFVDQSFSLSGYLQRTLYIPCTYCSHPIRSLRARAHTQTHTCTHKHTYTQTHTHTHAHKHTHTHTHIHTYTKYCPAMSSV